MRSNLLILAPLIVLLSAGSAEQQAQYANQAPAPVPGSPVSAQSVSPPAQSPIINPSSPAIEPGFIGTLKRVARAALLGDRSADIAARDAKDKEDGMQRMTDQNWKEAVEGEEGLLVLVIHGKDAISPIYLDAHTNATILARENKLEGVRWARIDYDTEYALCTKWLIFRPPYILFASSHGEELRFLGSRQLPASGENLYEVVSSGRWTEAEAWDSPYAPGNSWAWVPEAYLLVTDFIASKTSGIPTFVWLLLSGAVTQSVMGWLHKPGGAAAPAAPAGNGMGRTINTAPLIEKARREAAMRDAQASASGSAASTKADGPTATATSSARKAQPQTPKSRRKRAD